MKVRLITDSSANICSNLTTPISYVPLKIVTKEKEYTDTPDLDVQGMLRDLKSYKGTSGTACPGIQDWLDAFDNSDMVLGVCLTSGLSGCYNSGMNAVQEYTEQHPDAKVFLLDSLSTGPEMVLLLEKIDQMVCNASSFDDICTQINEYKEHTHLLFSLQSLDNLMKNGRVNPLVAKAMGILGLRIVGKASEKGTLKPMHKCRGEKKALDQLLQSMKEAGYRGGKVRITHSCNESAANTLSEMIRREFPKADISVSLNRGLCCFYAEEGAILVGFEDI